MALRTPQNDTINGIALCAGVGGLELGLHIAEPGYRTVCYVEREVFPAATLVARMEDKALDNAPIWDDVKTFDGRPWRGRVHLVAGGYPCQPFSFAGRKRGDKDPRHLWPDISRILRETDPEWCFFENVEGHLTLGADAVFKDLRKMDFTVKAGMFSALETGASQIRRRLFIVGHANKNKSRLPGRDGVVTGRAEGEAGYREKCWPIQSEQHGQAMDTSLDGHGSGGSRAETEFSVPVYPPPPHHFADWFKILKRRPDLQPELFGLDDGLANRVD